MHFFNTLYFSSLSQIQWQKPTDFATAIPAAMRSWLLEQDSLSFRLKQECGALSLDLLYNQMISENQLTSQEKLLLNLSNQNCVYDKNILSDAYSLLMRKVVIYGDNQPWVIGRTLISPSLLQHPDYDLRQQGETPLGFTVFGTSSVKRDELQVGVVEIEQRLLFARRSRLWVDSYPMLVTELFLPDFPIYSQC